MMSKIRPSDAAFEGFRITRERPRALAIWAAFLLIANVISAIYLISLAPEARAAIEASQGETAADPAALLTMLKAMFPMLVMGLVVQCIMATAIYRIILRPQDKGLIGYLSFGVDELRLIILTLIYVLLATVMIFGVILGATLVFALASQAGQGVGVFIGSVAELFALGLITYVLVRLSLAPVISFNEGRLAVFDSWHLTHGQFWRMTGTYGLALACMVVVALLSLILLSLILAIANGGNLQAAGAAFNPDSSSLAAYFKPSTILYLTVTAVLSAVYYVVMIAPAAVIFSALKTGDWGEVVVPEVET
jgi:hypothetical protein